MPEKDFNADFLISEIIFWYEKITWFTYDKNHFLLSENGHEFYISETHVYSDIRNISDIIIYFLISEIVNLC